VKTRVYIERESDRDVLITILARNGYIVRQGKEKPKGGTRWQYYVEYWREGE
jgi:hypothetical protein